MNTKASAVTIEGGDRAERTEWRDLPIVTHLLHVRLRVPDPEEAAAYYQRALGLAQVDANSSIIRLAA